MAVDLDLHDAIAVITINQPERLNALNFEQLERLRDRLAEATANPAVRVIIVTGAGDRAFVAGADIKQMATFDRSRALAFGELGHAIGAAIEAAPQPVIAAINGFALGGGCELALACDIRLASENAVFAQPEVGLGIPPGWGGTQRLPRVVGPGIAADLICSGRRIDAAEALRFGLVSAVHPQADLLPKAIELAQAIAAHSPRAVSESKRLMALTRGKDAASGLATEARAFADAFGTPDQQEGMAAFIEKRTPSFATGSNQ